MSPHEVLRVAPNASAAEIKRAYHCAVKRCHPDQFVGTTLFAQAQEELKAINIAYAALLAQAEREPMGSHTGEDAEGDSLVEYAYRLAISKQGARALKLLAQSRIRSARWHFVHGLCMQQQRSYREAISDFEAAARIDPHNRQYRASWREAVEQRKRRNCTIAVAGAAAAVAVTVVIVSL